MNAITLLRCLAIALCINTASQASTIELVHVHGLNFSSDGKQLIIPAHFGLAVYENKQWHKKAGPDDDFMGFTIAGDSWYSSGHPEAGTSKVNPFGLIKSTDQGEEWTQLGMQGEADFHTMAVGYNNKEIYLVNMMKNSQLPVRGLFHSSDDGKNWSHADADGAPEPMALAAHPDQARIVAIASQQGLYLSKNYGKAFIKLDDRMEVYSVFFDFNGQDLYYSGYDIAPNLVKININNGRKQFIVLPELRQDAVSFVAQNPKKKKQLAIATFNRNVYISNDAGKTWDKIANQGETLSRSN